MQMVCCSFRLWVLNVLNVVSQLLRGIVIVLVVRMIVEGLLMLFG